MIQASRKVGPSDFGRRAERGVLSPWVVAAAAAAVAAAACMLMIRQQDNYKKELAQRDQRFQARVDVEKKKIAEDLEEKYRADRISYEVMARQMARQNNSLRDADAQQK